MSCLSCWRIGRRPQQKSSWQCPTACVTHLARRILSSVGSPAELVASEEIFQVLAAVASVAQTTTYGVERAHSGNARRARGQPHTHRPAVSGLAIPHSSLSAPPFLRHQDLPAKPSKKRGRPRKSRQPPQQQPLDDDRARPPLRKKVKRPGGGGAWRAFQHVRVHIEGQKLDWRELALQYHALSDAEKQHFREIGREGPFLAQQSSFGFPAL